MLATEHSPRLMPDRECEVDVGRSRGAPWVTPYRRSRRTLHDRQRAAAEVTAAAAQRSLARGMHAAHHLAHRRSPACKIARASLRSSSGAS